MRAPLPFLAAALLSACASGQASNARPGLPTADSISSPQATRAEKRADWCQADVHASAERKHGVTGPLADLNVQFLEAHARARRSACERLEHEALVIRYAFGVIEARFRGKPLAPGTSNVLPAEYHPLKDVSHVVLLAALLFDERPGPERSAHAKDAAQAITAVLDDLSAAGSKTASLIPAAHVERQKRLLDRTRSALDALAADALTEEQRRAYFDSIRPELRENLHAISGALVRGLHRQVQDFRKQVDALDPSAWKDVVVVVAAAHQARAREIGVQYFERLLGERMGEGAANEGHLIVAESLWTGPEQYGLVSTHEVDRAGALTIFGEPARLQSDVLADDAGALEEVLPASVSGTAK